MIISFQSEQKKMSEEEQQNHPNRLLVVWILLFSPVLLFLVFFAATAASFSIPIILFVYVTVVVEGITLVYWVITRIHPEDSMILTTSIPSSDTDGRYRYYLQKNRAEVIAGYLKSATRRSSPYFRQHSREQIAMVLEKVLEEENPILLQRGKTASNKDAPISTREAQLSLELDFLLHPKGDKLNKKRSKESKEIKVDPSAEEDPIKKPRFDYIPTLEDVLNEISEKVEGVS
jgi:hypothetical protein